MGQIIPSKMYEEAAPATALASDNAQTHQSQRHRDKCIIVPVITSISAPPIGDIEFYRSPANLHNSVRAPILRLPFELRSKIYSLVLEPMAERLSGPPFAPNRVSAAYPESSNGGRPYWKEFVRGQSCPILHVCQQMRADIMDEVHAKIPLAVTERQLCIINNSIPAGRLSIDRVKELHLVLRSGDWEANPQQAHEVALALNQASGLQRLVLFCRPSAQRTPHSVKIGLRCATEQNTMGPVASLRSFSQACMWLLGEMLTRRRDRPRAHWIRIARALKLPQGCEIRMYFVDWVRMPDNPNWVYEDQVHVNFNPIKLEGTMRYKGAVYTISKKDFPFVSKGWLDNCWPADSEEFLRNFGPVEGYWD